MLNNRWTYPGLVVGVSVIATVALLLSGVLTSESQPQRPEFAGVPMGVLENAGVHLTLPVQAKGLLDEQSARAALGAWYAEDRIKEVAIANLKEHGYSGPVWVFNLDTTGETVQDNETVGRVEWHLLFMDAKTGEPLDEITVNNWLPDGQTLGPLPTEEPFDDTKDKDEGAAVTPTPLP